MICQYCRDAADWTNQSLHLNCLGMTWCDCQHKPAKKSPELEEYLNGQRSAQGGDKAPESA